MNIMVSMMRPMLIIASLALSSPGFGQAPGTPATEGFSPVSVIDAQDIPLEAERVLADLQYSEEALKGDAVESSLSGQLKRLSEQSRQLLENPASARPEELGVRARDWYRLQWQDLLSERDAFQRKLDSEVSGLQAVRTKLKIQAQTWRATREAYAADQLTAALRDRIAAVLAQIDKVDGLYAARLNALSRLYNEAQSGRRTVADILTGFAIAEQTSRSRMLALDSPPIWRLFDTRDTGKEPGAATTGKASTKHVDLGAMYTAYRSTWLIHGAIVLLLLGITLPLARRRKQWKDKPLLAQAVKLFSTPVSMAVLLTLLISATLFFTLPMRLLDLRSLLIAMLTLRILNGVLEGRIRVMLYMAIGLFIAAKLTDLADDFSIAERLGLLVVNLAAIVFMVYVSRALPTGKDQESWLAWARLLSRGAQPILAMGLIANILGNVSLAQTITTGSVYSVTAAVVMACGVLTLETIITALLYMEVLPQLRALYRHKDLIANRIFRFIRAVALLTWAIYTLYYFRSLDWIQDHVVSVVTYRIQVGSLDLSALDLIAFVVSLYLATLVSRFVRFILEEEVYERIQLPRGLPNTVSMLTNYGILALGFFVAISVAGIDMSRFAIIAGALGVGIGFGLQNVVNNFVSGLILAFERPIQVGDTIEVGQLTGHVMRIGVRSSTVRTYDGAEVIVPNGNLISAEVVNWTLSDRTRRLIIPVGAAYGSDPEKVLEVLATAVAATEGVMQYPQPSIIFQGFGDSSLNFSVRVWIKDFEEVFRISSDLSVKIYAALNEAGIEIPFPQRDLHLRSVSPGVTLSGPALTPEVAE
jgi:potassium efflux system protein